MTISFDKRLAELDAYLQMLLEKNESLDKRIEAANGQVENDGLELIKSNLESLLGSIKHAIVLLQIAKVSITSSSDPERPPIKEKTPSYVSSIKRNDITDRKPTIGSHRTIDDSVEIHTSRGGLDIHSQNSEHGHNIGGTSIDSSNSSSSTSNNNNTNNNNELNGIGPDSAGNFEQDNEDGGEDETFYDADEEQHQTKVATNQLPISDRMINWDSLYDEDEEDLTDMESEGTVIKHLISQIRIGMDLTKVVLPTFILERRSLLEMYADFFAHPDLFSTIPDQPTPEARFVQLVRWYLSAFHAGRKSSVAKKPYNPILGEIFICHWNLNANDGTSGDPNNNLDFDSDLIDRYSNKLADNSLLFVAEQVSHHPPVSAFYTENRAKRISCCAHIYTKSKFLGLSVGVHHVGKGIINLHKLGETYTCTFPSAFGRSILTVPWVELGGPVEIICEQTGYKANIEFITKPFYGGKKHRISGELLRPNGTVFMTIEGEWNGTMSFKDTKTGDKKVFVDTAKLPIISKNVRPIADQEPFESRNVWKEVTKALKDRNVSAATDAKSQVEQRQRNSLRDRTERQEVWETRFFKPDPVDNWTFCKPLKT